MTKTTRVILAYAAGQATQVIIHAMCLNNNMYAYRQIPFCIAAGFVILFAILTGVFIAQKGLEDDYEPAHEAPQKPTEQAIKYIKEHTDIKDGIEEVIPEVYEPNKDGNADVRSSNQAVR